MATVHELDHQRRADLANVVMQVLDDWDVANEHRPALLGLPATTRARSMNQFRKGQPFPDDEQVMVHVTTLLSINNAVRSMQPHNPTVGNYWITTPNAFFSDKSPLEIMVLHGLDGMRRVLNQLNGGSPWDNM